MILYCVLSWLLRFSLSHALVATILIHNILQGNFITKKKKNIMANNIMQFNNNNDSITSDVLFKDELFVRSMERDAK